MFLTDLTVAVEKDSCHWAKRAMKAVLLLSSGGPQVVTSSLTYSVYILYKYEENYIYIDRREQAGEKQANDVATHSVLTTSAPSPSWR